MSLKWWQKAVFYQIYPRSFADGNGDGVGDFRGIVSKLDYLKDLGIDAIWLSPHFPSPNWDWGYDISDYLSVAPEYGNLADFTEFLKGAHQRNIKVILDLVLNHTSDEHAWFKESRSSRENPKADWYLWVDTPPNNWQSCFDGAAWTYAPERNQYYYHYFMKQQPDLNWKNPQVKAAMWNAVRFWLDMGVDGYRLDAIGTIFEDPNLTNHSVPLYLAGLRKFVDTAKTDDDKQLVETYWRDMFKHQLGQPGLHEMMKELRSVIDEYDGDRLLVGEDDDLAYLGNGRDELHMVFNFPLANSPAPLSPAVIRKNQQVRLDKINRIGQDAWPCNTLGNHDRSRVISRFGDGVHDTDYARLSLALLLTLKGTPFLYYGEEIGMSDLLLDQPSQLRDTMAIWYYQSLVESGSMESSEAARLAGGMTRDKNRTPMQWSSGDNAGFCPSEATPWLAIHPNHQAGINVEAQKDVPGSILTFYKDMIRLRKSNPALVTGDYQVIRKRSQKYLAFIRKSEAQTVLVALNFAASSVRFTVPEVDISDLQVLYSRGYQPITKNQQSGINLDPFGFLVAIVPQN